MTIPYDYGFNSAEEIALDWLKSNGFTPVTKGEWKNGQTVVAIKDFRPLE